MPTLPTDWPALLVLVFALGLRHGIDADHIATIDALTRLQAAGRATRARWCGALFALGHGGAVLLLVAVLALAGRSWQPPGWLAPLGSALSIGLLAMLGLANLRAVLGAAPGDVVALRGWRGQGLARLRGSSHPTAAMAVGALFAVSFDTVSLALLLALTGLALGGASAALLLAGVFAAGMAVTDGANGFWLARLLARTDALAARASRTTAAVVAVTSLGVATLGVARWLSPAADAWADGAGLWLGAGLLAAVLGSALALLWRQGAAAPRPLRASTNASAS